MLSRKENTMSGIIRDAKSQDHQASVRYIMVSSRNRISRVRKKSVPSKKTVSLFRILSKTKSATLCNFSLKMYTCPYKMPKFSYCLVYQKTRSMPYLAERFPHISIEIDIQKFFLIIVTIVMESIPSSFENVTLSSNTSQ